MKRNPNYVLQEICGTKYLIPVGQSIADMKPFFKTNKTGAMIWEILKEELNEDEFLEKARLLLNIEKDSDTEEKTAKEELLFFIREMTARGLLDESVTVSMKMEPFCYRIAGMTLKLFASEVCIPDALSDFRTADIPAEADQCVELHVGVPQTGTGGKMLLYNGDLCVTEREDCYIILFPSLQGIEELRLKKDGSVAVFHVMPPFDEAFRERLFHALRLPFLYLAKRHGMYVLHSASILYERHAWLFSGKSGTGKSTHTNLWKRLFGTPVLNGDLNLLTIGPKGAEVRGIPWCGTSGICTIEAYPLGGIVLLKQGKEENLLPLSEEEKRLLVMKRLISPLWDEEMLAGTLDFVDRLAAQAAVYRFVCTKEESAAVEMKRIIDNKKADA